jgi:hypothetical protein
MTTELDELKAQNAKLTERIAKLEEAAKPPEPFVPGPRFQFDPTANASMPASAMKAMIDAVPESVMQGVRADAFKPNPVTSSPNPQPTSQVRRGSGWVSERGFPDRTKEFELMDRIVASQVGGPNEKVK